MEAPKKHTFIILDICLIIAGLLLTAPNVLRGSSIVAIKPYIASLAFGIELYFLARFYIQFKFRLVSILWGLLLALIIYFQIRYFIYALLNPLPKQLELNMFYMAIFQFIFLILVAIPIIARSQYDGLISLESKLEGKGSRLFILSLVLWSSMVLVYSPLTVYTSSWSEFDISMLLLTVWLLAYLLITFTVLITIYHLVPGELKLLLIWLMFLISVIFWFYTYIFPGDFGHLDKFIFSKPGILAHSVRLYQLLEMVSILAVSFPLILLLQRFPKKIMVVMVILNLMAFGQTLANVVSSGVFESKILKEDITSDEEPPAYASDLFSFSREQNVLIIMLDMFCGGFIPEILDKNPELYQEYEGFTWYANVLTTSDCTYGSIPSMVGGAQYTVDKMGENPNVTISEQYRKAYSFYPDFFKSNDFSVSFADPSYLSLSGLSQDNDILLGKSRDFLYYWQNKQKSKDVEDLNISTAEYSRIFAAIGLFKGSPFLLKRKIYDGSSWLKANSGNETTLHAKTNLALLDLAPELSNTDSPRKTFKYISNELSHLPWSIDGEGNISKNYIKEEAANIYYPDLNMIFINPQIPYNSAAKILKVLAQWFKWMKKEGVYDLTRIIIVSDHGYSGIDPMSKDIMVIKDDTGKVLEGSGRLHPLLMVKDFYRNGDLIRSDHFLTNADTAALATEGISSKDPFENPLNINSDSRELVTSFVPTTEGKNGKYRYKLFGQFRVKGSIFKNENWVDLLHSGK